MTKLKSILLLFTVLVLGAFYIGTASQESGSTPPQNELPSTGVDFSLDMTSGEAPLEVNVAVTERPEGEGWSYSWIFNDGPLVEGESATHVYEDPGEYNIIVLAERNGETKTAVHFINVTGEESLGVIQVPFEWDREVFPEAFEVLGFAGMSYLDSATTIPAYPPRTSSPNPTTPINVYDRNEEIVTYDTFIPGIKEYFTLEPEDNIRTEVYNSWIEINLPSEDLSKLYLLIDQHPHFQELVKMVREAKRFSPKIEGQFELVADIAIEVAKTYYQPSSGSAEGKAVE